MPVGVADEAVVGDEGVISRSDYTKRRIGGPMNGSLRRLSAEGVSVWLDDLRGQRLESGGLTALVRKSGVSGVTTNPTIFHQAISGGSAYSDALRQLAGLGVSSAEAVRLLTAQDVRAACDLLRPVFDASSGRDGFVSIEVDPSFARDAERTVTEARLLWWLAERPNVMIKVPATVECLPAVTTCLAEGMNEPHVSLGGFVQGDRVEERCW